MSESIFALYADRKRESELLDLYVYAGQNHHFGLTAAYLEKDVWVVEVLRLLYEERLLGEQAVAFKGGTALSKCWKAIHRFSEDIDLSIHWADLDGAEDEVQAWQQSTKTRSQNAKFRKRQSDNLERWSADFSGRLSRRLDDYGIEGLAAEVIEGSRGEQVAVTFPHAVQQHGYARGHILLEFGGRNRGRPTQQHTVSCYLEDLELSGFMLPHATVDAYDIDYIVWEKLTALHQYSTQAREPDCRRLARHWYDVHCLATQQLSDPVSANQAMCDVIAMKQQRWPEKGVDYELAGRGGLCLIPVAERLERLAQDHEAALHGRMFYSGAPVPSFDQIIQTLRSFEERINTTYRAAVDAS